MIFSAFSSDNRESSYLHAIAAAGVAYQVTKGCTQGNWDVCGCDSRMQGRGQKSGELSWEWGGCSEDFRFGYDYSIKFMDPSKSEKTISDYVIRHNNEAGRKVTADHVFLCSVLVDNSRQNHNLLEHLLLC